MGKVRSSASMLNRKPPRRPRRTGVVDSADITLLKPIVAPIGNSEGTPLSVLEDSPWYPTSHKGTGVHEDTTHESDLRWPAVTLP